MLSFYSVRPEVGMLKPYIPGKPTAEVRREYGLTAVIKLASNENPLGPSPLGIAAVQAAVAEAHAYPEATAPALRTALASHLGLPETWVMVGNGSDELLRLLGAAYIRPGDRCLVPACSFPNYRAVCTLFSGAVEEIALRDETMDLRTTLDRAEGARLIFLCRPNNPTGAVFAESEFTRLMDAISPETLVLIDQAYSEFDESPFDSLALLQRYPNLILTRTFSKAYGLAGFRVGYGMARPEIWNPLYTVREPFSVNVLAQVAAVAALQDKAHLAATLENNRDGLRLLMSHCEQMGLSYTPSHANFLLIDLGQPAEPVFQKLLQKGVIVRPCGGFGRPNWIRVSVGTPTENLRFVESLQAVL